MVHRLRRQLHRRPLNDAGLRVRRRRIDVDDEEGQIVAFVALQPVFLHRDRHVAVGTVHPRGAVGADAAGARGVGVDEFDGDGAVGGVGIGVPGCVVGVGDPD